MKHILYKVYMLWMVWTTVGLTACHQDEEFIQHSPIQDPIPSEGKMTSRSVYCEVKTTKGGELLNILDSIAIAENYSKEDITELTIKGPVTRDDLRILRPFQKITKLDLTDIQIIDEWGNQSSNFPTEALDSLASPAYVYLPTSITGMDWGCFHNSQITGVEMPDNISWCNSQVFSNCVNLKSVRLSQKLKELHYGLFEGCSSLSSIEIPQSVTYLGGHVFSGTNITSFTIPETVTTIEGGLFSNCKNLEQVTWTSTITEIPYNCFDGCEKLQFKIPDYITKICSSAFTACNAITDFYIPASVKEIEDNAFSHCNGLTNIHLPSSVEIWGNGIFFCCDNLKTVTGIENWAEIPDLMFWGCSTLNIDLPQKLEVIGQRAFAYCYQLQNPIFPATLKEIKDGAFRECHSINQIVLPEGIEKIGNNAFEALPQLKEILFPSSLKEIGDFPLERCWNLKVVYWNTDAEMPRLAENQIPFIYAKAGIAYDKNNGTNLIFGDDTNGWFAEEFFLYENEDFYCPKSFTAQKVVFRKWNGNGASFDGNPQGWKTISLPFTASKFVVQDNGEQPQRNIKPFGSTDMGDAKPFWLRSLHSDGFQRETVIEAGKPYIICFPNSEQYLPEYNIHGTIEYWGENTIVMASTDELTPAVGPDFTMHATFKWLEQAEDIYTLETRDVYDEYGNYQYWGQVWFPNCSSVNHFEAYVKPNGTAARSYSMGNQSASSRSAKILGNIPQESDMD